MQCPNVTRSELGSERVGGSLVDEAPPAGDLVIVKSTQHLCQVAVAGVADVEVSPRALRVNVEVAIEARIGTDSRDIIL